MNIKKQIVLKTGDCNKPEKDINNADNPLRMQVYQVKVKLTQPNGYQYIRWVGIDALSEYEARMKAEDKCATIEGVAFIKAVECNLVGEL